MEQNKMPTGAKKRSRGNRTLTVIFYTLYCIFIVASLAGIFYANSRLEQDLARYEESHISVQAEATFRELFEQPDWAELYRAAGEADTLFEGEDAYTAYMSAFARPELLSYESLPQDDGSFLFQVSQEGIRIGSYSMTDRRQPGDRWPSWQLDAITLDIPRQVTVQIRKLDCQSVTVNGVPLDSSYTQRITSDRAAEYTLPGTDAVQTHLQQVSGLLLAPEIAAWDWEGNPCTVVQDPATGIYEVQAPEALPLTEQLERIAKDTARAWGSYLLRGSEADALANYFDPREAAYEAILGEDFWTGQEGSSILSLEISDYRVYHDAHFSACVTLTAGTSPEPTKKTATFFFSLERDGWTCYEIQTGNLYTPTEKVRLEFYVDETPVHYDYCSTDRTGFYTPLVTAPEGFLFAGWGTRDGQLLYTPDETGYVTLSPGTVPEPLALHAIFQPIEGGQ